MFFLTALPCSGGYHLERSGMPLQDAVGVNCEKDGTTEYEGTYGKGCMLDKIVRWINLTCHGYSSSIE